jgi:hypothetical protein
MLTATEVWERTSAIVATVLTAWTYGAQIYNPRVRSVPRHRATRYVELILLRATPRGAYNALQLDVPYGELSWEELVFERLAFDITRRMALELELEAHYWANQESDEKQDP